MSEVNGNKIMVLLFDKGHYKRDDLNAKSDMEKYTIALWDKRRCWLYTADEYTDMLNNFKPIEKYVWTYIVVIPNEEQDEK